MPLSHDDYAIAELRRTHEEVMQLVRGSGDMSLALRVEAEFKKALVMAAASYFESTLTGIVLEAFDEGTNGNGVLVSFVRAKAVERRYHDWFNWKVSNANQFFGAFGTDFKEHMERKQKGAPEARRAVSAFLQLGHLRNEVAHKNYAVYSVQLTVDEIVRLYEDASKFVSEFADDVRQFGAANAEIGSE